MFDENLFRYIVRSKGKKIQEVAEALEINRSTLYRKMSGESDFYRDEIQKCCELLGEKDMTNIFFAQELRKRNKKEEETTT